jgi:uncharacterized SAM-binding protein YcdF (DUF218 family)
LERAVYFTLKAVLRSLLLPPAGPLILALIGGVLVWRRRRFGGLLVSVALASLWLLCTPIAADALVRLAEHYPALDLAKPTGAQAIVIIGGGGVRSFAPEFGGPSPESPLLERLGYGAFVARRTGLPVLVSGAPEEALAMRVSLARDFGVPVRWSENQSLDTYQNARLSAPILRGAGVTRIILVTSSTQLWRALHEFQSVGFEVVPAPAAVSVPEKIVVQRFVPGPAALMRSNAALHELIGEAARRVQAALGLRERFDRKAAGVPAP